MMLNKVSLNTIGLNRIGLNRIGKPSRGSSDRPYIDPEVLASLKAVCICYGKSNDDPDRAIVKNLVDPDNPFVISNAAYTEGSGYADKGSPYYGAFVTDGIDDLITSTKTVQEMLGGSNECTVLSMIHQITDSTDGINRNNWLFASNSYLESRVEIGKKGKTGIYGYTSTDISNGQISNINTILGDKGDYTVYSKIEDAPFKYFSVEGFEAQGIWYTSSVAWYWNFISNKYLTTDQINQVIAYFNLDRTLKSDIYCNIAKQGITNENHTEFGDKLIDFSGNGRDIQLNNIAWKGDSGIGKYNFSNINIIASNRFEGTVTTNKCHFTKKLTDTTNNFCDLLVISPNEPIKFKVSGLSDGRKLFVANKSGSGSNYNFDNGEHEVSLSFSEGVGQNNPFGVTGDIGDIDVTVEFIPSHEGALCLDGVNDFGKVTGMPIYKDYTFIIDRKFLNETFANQVCLASKSKVAVEGENGGAFIIDNISINAIINPYSFYKTTSLPNLNTFDKQIVFQTKYKYLGKDIAAGTATDSDTLWLGTFRDNDSRFANVAIYSLMSFPYSMSEFLIERQLKKHKLGTLYPDMVEFRPVIKQNDRIKNVKYYKLNETADYIDLNIGDYIPVGQRIAIVVDLEEPYEITSITSSSLTDVEIRKAGGQNYAYDILGYVTDKSPQKISLTIEQDENYVLFNPTINSNVILEVGNEQNITELTDKIRNHEIDGFIMYLSKRESKYILPNSWINKDTEVIASIYCLDNILQDDLHINIDGNSKYCLYADSSNNIAEFIIMDDNIFEEQYITNVLTANTIDIQLDQYIRYEDIVHPYPVLLRFNDENGNEVSWGGKFRVGSTITRIGSIADPESNLLNGLYSVSGLSLNGKAVTNSTSIVEKQMVFKTTATYLLDNNEPTCILSPRTLKLSNSTYKILGYIPDISGNGNHGILHNSAYIEGSGANEDGSYQFDGVNDFVTIPTLSSGGKQVLMKVNWHGADDEVLYDQRNSNIQGNYDLAISTYPDTIAYNFRNEGGKTFIDGILNSHIITNNLKNITHNISSINGYNNDNNSTICIGKSVFNGAFAQMALYDFMLFDNISTDDKIKELNEYVGIEAKVELPPYYWDNYGKTNLDEDKATIQQRGVAVGDYDITNYNHDYDKMSGYGGYEFAKFDNTSEWIYTNNSDTIEVVNRDGYAVVLRKVGNGTNYWHFRNTIIKSLGQDIQIGVYANKSVQIVWQLKYKLEGETDYNTLAIASPTIEGNINTYVTLPYKTEQEIADLNAVDTYYSIYFIPIDLDINEEVTIEMLPLYPNGLVYDGVTDYSKNANIPALTDYTYVFKREFLYNANASASMYSGSWQALGGGAFISDFCVNAGGANDGLYGFSFGNSIKVTSLESSKIIYGTKTSVNGTNITPGSNIGAGNSITLGKWGDNYRKFVFYKLVLYPKTIPLLQINFLKNMMEKDEIIDLNNPIFIQE